MELCTKTARVNTYYVLGAGQVLAEYVNPATASTPKSSYIYAGSNRIAMRDANKKLHYYLNDHLGSARVVIDSTGVVKDKYWYCSFGESRNEVVSTNQSYRYTSKPLDKEGGINIYYYGARYYDPELGRFWAIDPAASKYPGWSPYAYTLDNPLRNVDPDGRGVLEFLGGVAIGKWEAVKSAGAGLYGLATNPKQSLAGDATLATNLPAVVGSVASSIETKWGSGDQGKGEVIGRIAGEITLGIVASKGFDKLGKIGESASVAADAARVAERGTHAVYQGVDVAGKVRYVGSTGQTLAARAGQHGRAIGTGRELLRYEAVKGGAGLTKTQARTWEQSLIDKYGMQKSGGDLLNKINAMAK